MRPRDRWRRILGSALLGIPPLALVLLLASPAVRRPLGRTFATLAQDWFGPSQTSWRLPLAGDRGVRPGHPVFLADRAGSLSPVAWVRAVEPGGVFLVRAPGVALPPGPWRLDALSVPSSLADIWEMALPPQVGDDLERRLLSRLEGVLVEVVLPAIEARLPAFLARIDPLRDERSREVFETVGGTILGRLRPLVAELTDRILQDLDAHLDLLDRLGLLWKLVRGDEKGLRRELLPVAERSAERWWAERRAAVLDAVGEGLREEAPVLRSWFSERVLEAAAEEIALPVLASERRRLEGEAEAALGDVLRSVVNAPEGGFRVRFAAVLRNRLLEKDEPLLLLRSIP